MAEFNLKAEIDKAMADRIDHLSGLLSEARNAIGGRHSNIDLRDRIDAALAGAAVQPKAVTDPKPWVSRTWQGARVISECRFAEAWEAQDALTAYAQRGGLGRVTIDHEPRAADPTPAPQPTVVLHDNKANVSVRCPDCDDGAYKGTDRICLTCNGLGELRRATFPTPAAQPSAALSYAQLDAANVGLANESFRLQEALRFYADKQHIQLSEPSKWDAPDDEASNWLCDDAGTATIEDGWMAREALKPFEVTAVPTTEILSTTAKGG